MAETILVAGTASHVGKSTVVAGLCRRLANSGVDVAPFKAQNMSNNARAVATPEGGYGEIGVSQYTQARAARIRPTTDTNPVLLKPRGNGESQLVVHGEAVGHFDSGTYYDEHWERARAAAVEAHDRLADRHEVVVAEGAGGLGEINLHDRDLANVETARFADATVLLLGDIERGGVFASLYGTLELAPEDVRERVAGTAITKFRGDPSLLQSGIEELEERTGVPVLDVLPYDDPGLPAEDSLSLPPEGERAIHGDGDGVCEGESVTVAVPRLPHVSNFTDLEPVARTPGVRVAYVPLSADLDDADAVLLPGTKNTVDDLLALDAAGFDRTLSTFSGPVVGVCGGYQILGQRITNADVEGTDDVETVAGLGLLPVETRFRRDKRVRQVTVRVAGAGPIAGAAGTASGYEIHMGRTRRVEGPDTATDGGTDGTVVSGPLEAGSVATDRVLGTYLHGLFENDQVRSAFVRSVRRHAGVEAPPEDGSRPTPFADAAALVDGIDCSVLR